MPQAVFKRPWNPTEPQGSSRALSRHEKDVISTSVALMVIPTHAPCGFLSCSSLEAVTPHPLTLTQCLDSTLEAGRCLTLLSKRSSCPWKLLVMRLCVATPASMTPRYV